MLFNFIAKRIEKNGRMNTPGAEFFRAPEVVEKRIVFEPPHSCFAGVVKYNNKEKVEVAPEDPLCGTICPASAFVSVAQFCKLSCS